MSELLKNLKYSRDIKSKYVQKGIFSFLNEKEKLNMIVYNKKLQKILGVDIKDYQKVSQKFKIGNKDGEMKEYDLYTKELIFEGEYLNGKRNGKGKEYNEGHKLIFEGEYKNGKKYGQGKEYDENGQLLFEGEYLYGEKNGKGKEYDENGKIKFVGDYLNGKRNGRAKEYYNGDLSFEGEYLNGKRWNGKFKEYYDNGDLKISAEYLDGKIWNETRFNKNNNIEFIIKNGKGEVKEYYL